MFLSNQNMPRWLVFLVDLFFVFCSVILAYLVRFNFNIPGHEMLLLPKAMITIILVRSVSFFIAKTYAGIIRYTSTEDASRIFIVILAGSILISLLNVISYYFINEKFLVPFSVTIIEFLLVLFTMITFRMVIKVAYLQLINPKSGKTNILIYGAGEAAIITKRALDRDAGSKYNVLAFVDDDKGKWGKKVDGITIVGFEAMGKLLAENPVENVILSIQKLKPEKKQAITELCLQYNTPVLSVPPVTRWINGQLSFNQIRKIKIEDLLERDEIKLSSDRLREEIKEKSIMITGAAGSIGSELARQLLAFSPGRLILVDQAESAMFELENELNERFPNSSFELVIGDICNAARMKNAFSTYKPDLVYHAAAYKHVPMMEDNPTEAVYTNVRGTRELANLADAFGVDKFIMISTDKAVNPTNVMGASKRIAEMYTQSLNIKSKTRYITTRFGNVLGSNGSAVNLFRKQIEKGGPVTVTHPEVIRYFMTIPEASQLVLEAGMMGQGGEIYLFDMGKPVKILDLAAKMIKLSGLEVGKDIEIKFTGLRPGEKLYEELLNDGENSMPTHHDQIMIGKVRTIDFEDISKSIDELIALFDAQDNEKMVRKMKQIVPEFKSRNSIYEKLDAE